MYKNTSKSWSSCDTGAYCVHFSQFQCQMNDFRLTDEDLEMDATYHTEKCHRIHLQHVDPSLSLVSLISLLSTFITRNPVLKFIFVLPHILLEEQAVHAAMTIRGLGIRGFDNWRTQKQ